MTSKRDDLGELFSLDGGPGPARRIPSAKAAALVEAALAGANFAEGTAPETSPYDAEDDAPTRIELRAAPAPVEAPRPMRRAQRVLLAAAVLGLLVGGTAAGAYVWVKRQPAAPAPAPAPPAHVRAPIATPAPEPSPVPQVTPIEAPPPAELDMPVDRIEKTRRARPAEVVEKEAEDLLARANALRGERKWQEADDVYDQVTRKYPRSAAAYVAQVASAGLRLDHLNDAASARKLYRAALALRPSGPLAEEASYGLARALRALGDVAGERRALEAFVGEYPDSPLQAHAQKRLTELGRR